MANAAENEPIGSACGAGGDWNEFSAEEYWTEERRRRAEPVPMPKPGGGGRPATKGEALPEGPSGHTPPSHGEENNPALHLEPRGTGGQPVPQPLNYPFCTAGKLLFVRNGRGKVASAALISKNILLTAGHIVYNHTHGWSVNPAFYPSYPKRPEKPKKDPAYMFAPSWQACWNAWYQDSNLAYDYGMMWIDADPGNMIGWIGVAWGLSTENRTWNEVGYPISPNPPFNGKTMDAVLGQFAASDVPGTIGLTNDNMAEGSSGAPWITDWNEALPAHANSVKSFIHAPEPIGYGPRFTSEVGALMDYISNPANRKPRK
jgi:hypothetical protein